MSAICEVAWDWALQIEVSMLSGMHAAFHGAPFTCAVHAEQKSTNMFVSECYR